MTETATKKATGIVTLPVVKEMAETYSLAPSDFLLTMRKVAMPEGISDPEIMACLLVAHAHKLNPLTKEIYFMKTKSGGIQPIVSVDGWIKKCNEHPQFDGMEFEDHRDDKGKVTAISCTIYRKDRARPIKVTEYMDECFRKSDKKTPWDSHPIRMLRHKSLIQCARLAFGFAGVMDPDEFETWQTIEHDATPKQPARRAPTPDDVPDIDMDEPLEAITEAEIVQETPFDDVPDIDLSTDDRLETVDDHDDATPFNFDAFLLEVEGDLTVCSKRTDVEEVQSNYAEIVEARLNRGQRAVFEGLVEDALKRFPVKKTAAK